MNLLKIGTFAKLNNVSVQTLRYYDKIALLKPNFIDKDTQYRYYSLAQSAELDVILFLQSLDFSLTEIKSLISKQNQYERIDEKLDKKTKELEAQIKNIETKYFMIKQFQDSYECFKKNQDVCDVRIEWFEERAVHCYQTNKNIYDMSLLEYEENLRNFKLSLKQEGMGAQFFANVGSIMKAENFKNSNFTSTEMFIFTSTDHLSKKSRILKSGEYAVSFCHLFENELDAIKSLHAFLIENNYKVNGDYICEVIYELPYAKPDQRNMFIRLQVPVIKIK